MPNNHQRKEQTEHIIKEKGEDNERIGREKEERIDVEEWRKEREITAIILIVMMMVMML